MRRPSSSTACPSRQWAPPIAAADFDMPVGDVTLGTQDIALGVYGSVDVNADFRNLPIQTPSGQMVAPGRSVHLLQRV